MSIIERTLNGKIKPRKIYELGIKGYDILSNEGFGPFCKAFSSYLKHKKQYKIWIKNNEPNRSDLKKLANDCRNFEFSPKISIVTPTWNTGEIWLKRAIDSVLDQVYYNWELCIADGGSDVPKVREILTEYSNTDARIKIKLLDCNKGIAANSNEALSLASGDYIVLLDHDDELAPFALYEVVKLLNEKPNLDFIYSDEDKIDENDRRSSPFFKPNWSPDMFLSCNYPIHISVLRKSIINDIGGFREGYDGSQDYDLLLRVSEIIEEKNIAHIPKILYHWRTIPTSTAFLSTAKPYAYEAAKKALEDAMKRRRIDIEGIDDGLWIGSYRIKYRIIGTPCVTIIIPTKDKSDVLRNCISSILECTAYPNYEIMVVNNQSQENATYSYYDELESNSKIRILDYNDTFNFSAINNFAVSRCNSEYILFLNNDTKVASREWLSAMLEHAQRPDVGAVGGKLIYPSGLIQHCGIILGYGNPKIAGHHYCRYPDVNGYGGVINTVRNFSAVTGACMLTRKSVFLEVGGLDEENFAVAFNDIDYCLKLREHGYLIVYTPYAKMYHYESLSRGYEDTPNKRARFSRDVEHLRNRWGYLIDNGDPYYNPNLTLEKADFSIKI